MRQIAATILLILVSMAATAAGLRPSDVPNPQDEGRGSYVSDMVGALSPEAKAYINDRIGQMREETGMEAAIAIVPSVDGDSEDQFATDLYRLWGIGSRQTNNGLLWLYVADIRAMRLETGIGVEGLLPDAFLSKVLRGTVFPLMREGETDKAFTSGIDLIYSRLMSEEGRMELTEARLEKMSAGFEMLCLYLIVSIAATLLALLLVYNRQKKLRGENNVRYAQMHDMVAVVLVLTIFFAIPMVFLLAYVVRFRNRQRTRACVCPSCGGSMRRLSEDEEDAYLTHKQQTEETVKSMDYDVWKCNVCGDTKILQYKKNSRYNACPVCGAAAYSCIGDNIVRHASAYHSGRGEKIYECASCHARKSVPYTIPRTGTPPLIIGGGGSHGGGGLSGGFGGGFSAGGGAGGRF